MVAARSNDVAFMVLLAGTGLPGDEVIYAQGRLIGKVMGADEKELDKQRDVQKQLFDIVKTETNHDKIDDAADASAMPIPERRCWNVDSFVEAPSQGWSNPLGFGSS